MDDDRQIQPWTVEELRPFIWLITWIGIGLITQFVVAPEQQAWGVYELTAFAIGFAVFPIMCAAWLFKQARNHFEGPY